MKTNLTKDVIEWDEGTPESQAETTPSNSEISLKQFNDLSAEEKQRRWREMGVVDRSRLMNARILQRERELADQEAEQRKAAQEQAQREEEGTKKNPYNFQITNNISRNTFNTIRDNPGQTRIFITRMLESQGYKPASIASLVSQMLRQGMVIEREGQMFAQQPEFTSLKHSSRARKVSVKSKAKAQPVKEVKPAPKKQEEGIAALPAAATAAQAVITQITSAPSWNISTILDNLSVRQARELYDELHKILGGR